jgi:hypothetical protein
MTADHESKFCETLNGLFGNHQDGIGANIDTRRAMAIIGEYVSRINKARSDEWDATTIKFRKRIAELEVKVDELKGALYCIDVGFRWKHKATPKAIAREALAGVVEEKP